jgi:hypothetical protein
MFIQCSIDVYELIKNVKYPMSFLQKKPIKKLYVFADEIK